MSSSDLIQTYSGVWGLDPEQSQRVLFHILKEAVSFQQTCGTQLCCLGTWGGSVPIMLRDCDRNCVTMLEGTFLSSSLTFFQLPCCEGPQATLGTQV